MITFVNGEFLPEEQAKVSILDRGFLYGDGLFETLRLRRGKIFRWGAHFERMRLGAAFAGIRLPFGDCELRGFAEELAARNSLNDALLRITLSRGVGVRGYSPRGAESPTLAMTAHACSNPDVGESAAWKLITSSFRLPARDPLARFKTCNKLLQVLARAEADAASADEALLLNTDGNVVEGSSSNLFWIRRNALGTAPAPAGILPGVTRSVVFQLAAERSLEVIEEGVTIEELRHTQGVFLSVTSSGVVPAGSLDGVSLPQHPLVRQLREDYVNLLERETGAGAR